MILFNRDITQRVLVIAEIGLCHNGDPQTALQLIEAARKAGADVVKFQKRTVERLPYPLDVPVDDPRFPDFTGTVRELRERHEFGMEQYRVLKDCAEERGLGFLVTPFDIDAVAFCEKLGVEAYKVASHSVTDHDLLQAVRDTGKPVLMSTGMATGDEVFWACWTLRPSVVLHCVSCYPTKPEDINLAAMGQINTRHVGYSGHEVGYIPTLAAVARGARVIERHITLDNDQPGFDHNVALNPADFTDMVKAIREVEACIGSPTIRIYDCEMDTRRKYVDVIHGRG